MKWDRAEFTAQLPRGKITTDDRERMRIVIPSMGRADAVNTIRLNPYPREWRPFTYLCVPESEAEAYREALPGVKQLIHGDDLVGIGPKRQHIWERSTDVDFLCMVDDDLRFAKRPDGKLVGCVEADMCQVFDSMLRFLRDGWLHASISSRHGNNRVPENVKVVGRHQRVQAHNHHACMALGVRWDRDVEGMEDFDVLLQLLRLGHPNAIVYYYAQDQGSSNAPGGCALWRTPETQSHAAHRLHELHPDFVTVVERPAGNWDGFGDTREDVRVQWRKAFQSWPMANGRHPDEGPLAPKLRKRLPRKKKLPTKKQLPRKRKKLPTKRRSE